MRSPPEEQTCFNYFCKKHKSCQWLCILSFKMFSIFSFKLRRKTAKRHIMSCGVHIWGVMKTVVFWTLTGINGRRRALTRKMFFTCKLYVKHRFDGRNKQQVHFQRNTYFRCPVIRSPLYFLFLNVFMIWGSNMKLIQCQQPNDSLFEPEHQLTLS